MIRNRFGHRRMLVRCGWVGSVLLLGVWIATTRLTVGYVSPGGRVIEITWGCVVTGRFPPPGLPPQWSYGFQVRLGDYTRIAWLPRTRGVISVPLWIPLVLVAVPTAVTWYRDRRRSPVGHCRECAYDLTGNVSGVCPECGTPIRPDS